MITSTTNSSILYNSAVSVQNLPHQPDQTQSISKNPNPKKYKKIPKTIRDFNPNPNLLSKKAIKIRKQKMAQNGVKNKDLKTISKFEKFGQKSADIRDRTASPLQHSKFKLGSRQKLILTTTNENLISPQIAAKSAIEEQSVETSRTSLKPEALNKVLGSRQELLVTATSGESHSNSRGQNSKQTKRVPWSYKWKQKLEHKSRVTEPRVKSPRKSKINRRGKVRKVLKGRRKLSSAESLTKTFKSA